MARMAVAAVLLALAWPWQARVAGAASAADLPAGAASAGAGAPVRVVGDAIPQPLTAQPGDPQRGRAVVADRRVGLCLLCHAAPVAQLAREAQGPQQEHFQGNLAPDLAGAGARWSEGQLRLRVADAKRLHPESIMPVYWPLPGVAAPPLYRVGPAWQGRPILDAQQIEDVVAWLRTLR